MFEAAELGRKISKKDFQAQLPELRAKLLEAQLALQKSQVPVVIIISGVDGAGKGDVVHCLNEWLDPRGIDTQAFWQLSDEESERPPYWRFWRVLPSRGRIGIFFGSWYADPILDRVHGKIKDAELDAALKRIMFFERMLVDDGVLLIKLWFHLSKKAQHARLKDLQKNRETRWRVLPTDWKHHKLYDKFAQISERAIRQTDSGEAPWSLVEATDSHYRDLTVGQLLLEFLQQRLKVPPPNPPKPKVIPTGKRFDKGSITILDHVDLSQDISDEKYRDKLAKYQSKLNGLVWKAWRRKVSSVVVFEGWDAAGKGSGIRRVTQAIDPRLYRLIPVAAPTDEERAHHYLWRFWRHLPRAGMFTIFDRSWYGRVLVERVEGFAKPTEWTRAYHEINDFEEQLVEHGIVLSKFWIHISKEEQLRRFKKREEVSYKRYKITEDDWRNRAKWDLYKTAVNDMVARTSTEFAPWTLVAGNDKKVARIQILKTLCDHLERAV